MTFPEFNAFFNPFLLLFPNPCKKADRLGGFSRGKGKNHVGQLFPGGSKIIAIQCQKNQSRNRAEEKTRASVPANLPDGNYTRPGGPQDPSWEKWARWRADFQLCGQLEEMNLQSLCIDCHAWKTKEEN